eukprot:735150_1
MAYSPKEDQVPKYFMQVTSVDEDVFHVNVVADVATDHKRKLFIKDMNHFENMRQVIIKNGEISGGGDMDMHESETYRLAIYASCQSAKPISDAKLELTVLRERKEIPPTNTQYKPQCIDSEAVFQVKNEHSKQINIYWSIPPQSFGNVSYRIVTNNEHKTQSISSLPYCVPYSQIGLGFNTFRVITVTQIEERIYESNLSDLITIKHYPTTVQDAIIPIVIKHDPIPIKYDSIAIQQNTADVVNEHDRKDDIVDCGGIDSCESVTAVERALAFCDA